MAKTSKTLAAPDKVSSIAISLRLTELSRNRTETVGRIVALEKAGRRRASLAEGGPQIRELDQAARDLLNGEAAALPAPVAGILDDLRSLDLRLAVIDRALALGGEIALRVGAREAAARVVASSDDWAQAMRGVVDAVLQLEHALQRRDELARKINAPGAVLDGSGWAFMGRIRERAGVGYSFLLHAVRCGWLSMEQLEQEVRRARESAKS